MVTRNGGRDVLPTVGMTFANQGMIAPDQMAPGLAGTTTGPSSAAPPTRMGPGLEGPRLEDPGLEARAPRVQVRPAPGLAGTPITQEAGLISQRTFPEIPIIGRLQTVPGRMGPGRTAPGLAAIAISGPTIVAQVATTEIPVLRILNVVPVIARILIVPIDTRLISPALTATGAIAAMATIAVVGRKAAADLPGLVSGPPALPVSTGTSVGMTDPVFQRTGTGMIPAVTGPVVMNAPVTANPLVPPVLVGLMAIASVIQTRTAHPASRGVRAGATGPTNRRSNG